MPFFLFFTGNKAGNENLSLVDESNEKVLRWQEKDNGGRRKKHSYKIQDYLFKLGQFVQSYSTLVILTVLTFFCICCVGLQYVRIETDIVKLWVNEGGRLNEELRYFKDVQDKYGNKTWTDYDQKHYLRGIVDPKLSQIREDEATNSGYQVLIQTAENPNENLLNKQGLLRHVELLNYIVNLQVSRYGINWTLSDICFKPGALDIPTDSIAYGIKPILERLIPCIWITPIDCFYEGSKPIGPHPSLKLNDLPMGELVRLAIPDLPDENNWSNLNPENIVDILSKNFDLGTMVNFFSRTGIGLGYLDRPCIDPLDPTCPKMSPNYFDACPGIQRLEDHLMRENKTLDSWLVVEEEKKAETSFLDIFGAFMGPANSDKKPSNGTKKEDAAEKKCTKYRKSFLNWMQNNPDLSLKILGIDFMPTYPDYGNVMRKGCHGFVKDVMTWPVDMILGGVSDDGQEVTAEALQSVLLVSSATDVYKRFLENGKAKYLTRFNETTGNAENLTAEWSPLMAREIINEWQRKFTSDIYNHDFNFIKVKHEDYEEKIVHRTVHPLAAASISDILGEYCDFNYQIIFLGYLLMLVYAVYSQVRFESWCLLSSGSAVTLALAGVLTVTFTSLAGLGFVTWFGVEFNAATTQVIPFLTLGIGVDNMFMLLHNYPHVVKNYKQNEIGMLMKETGMSILLTSVNNILSFLTGTILPIPALRSFCTQSSVLLTFNLIAIMTVYPAIISIDLRRRKSGRRDICCCLKTNEDPADNDSYEAYGFDLPIPLSPPVSGKPQYHGLISVNKEDDEEHNEVRPWSLHALLRNYYVPFISQPVVKAIVIISCLCLFIGSAFEIRRSTIGLELSDVLPEHTAPAAFLKARDEYFSFYPMFVVIKGEKLDFAQRQTEIEHLRNEIAKSRFIIKLDNGEPSERYWLGLFREWLIGLQEKLDKAKTDGILDNFDTNNHTKSPELKIAYSLACSYGENYDCSRAGKIKLVDETGTINTEGFYNYLNGWQEYESMFYSVSQASFYPPMRKLRQGPKDNKYRYFIPPAPKPIYSQIPFYLTGLKDTAVIVEMIKEIRAICEKYTEAGVPNYPSGIAFTFWEQYLDLNWNLVKAIGLISLAVFIVVSVMLFSPWAAACILLVLMMMTVELAGFLGFCKIKLNPVSAVSLITAVGIGVEFTAHVVFAFITSPGTRNERMAQAIDLVFAPVIHGALSTLLGIIMLGFSEFEFVVKYFFVIMSALIVIGLINGLMLLPVILSIYGPSSKLKEGLKGFYEEPNCVWNGKDDVEIGTQSDANSDV